MSKYGQRQDRKSETLIESELESPRQGYRHRDRDSETETETDIQRQRDRDSESKIEI